jgi:O-acetyl-ADP-ribose deacetylase (regulator of RNase III)
MIEILRGDITQLEVDAIVNAANSALGGGGGVDGAIHRAAGPELHAACLRLGGCPTGSAVLTPGFELPARFVIHAVGPIWRRGGAGEAGQLRRAYEASFARAREQGTIRSIAFPAISSGSYGFPKDQAARIALEAMKRHEAELDRIVACVFDAETEAIYRQALLEMGR